MSVASADRAVRTSVYRAGQLIDLETPAGRDAAKRLLRLLVDADGILAAKLQREANAQGGESARFTGASAIAYRRQVGNVVDLVTHRLNGLTAQQARGAIKESMAETIGLLETLEARFSGVTRPLRIRQAQRLDAETHRTGASLLRQHATSVDRYGQAMIKKFERTIATGLVAGLTQREMLLSLTGHGGPTGTVSMRAVVKDGQVHRIRTEHIPEGLFKRYRFWAERIVRTEVANAYSAARLDGLVAARATDFPDLKKKILAVFDNRTAPDSLGVHGQVRELEGFFQDGAGRVYQRPPARPNDRETIIPWRDHWPDTRSTQPLTKSEQFEESEKLRSRYPVAPPRPQEVAQEHAAAAQIAQQAHADALAVKAQQEANASAAAAAVKAPQVPVDEKVAAKAAARAAKLAAKSAIKAAAREAKKQAKLVASLAKKQIAAVEKAAKAEEKKAAKLAAREAAKAAKLAAKQAAKQAKIDAKAAAKAAKLQQQLTAKNLAHLETKASVHTFSTPAALEEWIKAQDPHALAAFATKHGTILGKFKVKPVEVAPAPAPTPAGALYSPSTHTLKESGGYVDVFDANGAKVAYFKKSGSGGFDVTPPDAITKIAGLHPQSFVDQHEAAAYALKVSQAIKANASAADKLKAEAKAKAEAEREKAEKRYGAPKSAYGPMKFEAKARADIDARMARIRLELAQELKLRSTSATAIDDYMSKTPGMEPARSWISRWLSSSGGHEVGHLLTVDKPTRAIIDPILRRINLEVNAENAAKLVHAIREQYAATQVALERRGITERVVLRGISGTQASEATRAAEAARSAGRPTISIALHGSSSWTTSRSTAASGFGSGGGVMQSRVHASRFIFVHDQSAEMERRYSNEEEWIVMAPEHEIEVDVDDWIPRQ